MKIPYHMEGGDTPEKTKKMEDCVNRLTGTNKRTGQPYTKSEKIAICKASIQRGKAAVDEEDEEEVEMTMSECMRKMMSSGKCKTTEEAKAKCDALLAKASFDPKVLYFIIDGG